MHTHCYRCQQTIINHGAAGASTFTLLLLLLWLCALQFDALEQKLTTQLSKLFEARRRRSMYLGFAQDPVAFLNTIIASQVMQGGSSSSHMSCV